MIYIYIENEKFKKQIKYTFDYIFFVLGEKIEYIEYVECYSHEDVVIFYMDNENTIEKYKATDANKIFILNSHRLFGKYYMKEESIPDSVEDFEGIISIYHKSRAFLIDEEGFILTNIDIISDIFFMLSRYEEYIYKNEDECINNGRFITEKSLAFRFNFIKRPIVNEDIDFLCTLLKSFNYKLGKKSYFSDKNFLICLTHDIDRVYFYKSFLSLIKRALKNFLVNKSPIKGFACIFEYFKALFDYRHDRYNKFGYLMDLEKKYSFSSSFYFMSYGSSKFDSKYSLKKKRLRLEMANIEKEGFELSYHASYNAYNDYYIMNKEINRLNKYINSAKGVREHYLRFSVPNTWRIQSNNKLLYDTTLGYADVEGFRCGTCIPYRPYDIYKNEVLDIYEIPLVIMDTTLLDKKYRGLNKYEAYNSVSDIIIKVKKYNGIVSILWHNTSFCEEFAAYENIYEEILRLIRDLNGLGVSCIEALKNMGGVKYGV